MGYNLLSSSNGEILLRDGRKIQLDQYIIDLIKEDYTTFRSIIEAQEMRIEELESKILHLDESREWREEDD